MAWVRDVQPGESPFRAEVQRRSWDLKCVLAVLGEAVGLGVLHTDWPLSDPEVAVAMVDEQEALEPDRSV